MSATLRQLIEKATPGSWVHLNGERIVFTRLNDGCRGLPVVTAEYEYLPHAQANLSLIARCNPATMLAVLEHLEAYAAEQRGFAAQIISPFKLKREYEAKAESVEAVIRLLNANS